MTRDEVVAEQLSAVQSGQTQLLTDALTKCFDEGESNGTGPGLTQADVDAAVKAAVDPLQAQIVQDKADMDAAHADADAKLAALQSQLDAAIAQDNIDKSVVANFQGAVASLQGALDALKAAIPAPAQP